MSDMALEPDGSVQLPEGDTATSTTGTDTVPKERFNGLQRAHQEALTKLRAFEAAQASPTTPTATTAEPTTSEENTGLEAFLADLMVERMDNWRDKAIEAYPQVAPLREYLTANTRNEVMALAKDLAEKLGGTPTETPSEEAPTVTATETPSTPSPSVTGGSPAISSPTDDEELADLRAKAARTHSDADYSAYLQKKFELAGVEYPS